MADRTAKYPENAPGPFYVDQECIFCEACIEIAPEHFMAEGSDHAYVARQPENDSEWALCKEAVENCPVEAIGDDGAE